MPLRDRIDTTGVEAGRVAASGPRPATLARWALGAMLVAAGAHKLLDPGAWTVYVTDWLAPWLVVSPTVFMLANGYLELAFGAALLADRYTVFASFVAAVSLTATVGYLAVVWATGGAFGDVLARDVGLAGLAWAVLAAELRPDPGE
ncbi:DoxX family membrane protein [Halobacterium zhouii]|uniref:DoxX family membrane protein n=1 Tax=Halobacterium zhouii TaxID=2902624 RepID=UPI001E398C98|nr:DoxX family membrane protein [Halobacterium zhouii]